MKVLVLTSVAAMALALCACQKPGEKDPGPGSGARGRYVGVGMYPATALWAHLTATAPTDPAAARLDDDEQVIVVMDSATGELRQCGNLSGHCIGFNPWGRPLPEAQVAPAKLLKPAQDLTGEASATVKVVPPPTR